MNYAEKIKALAEALGAEYLDKYGQIDYMGTIISVVAEESVTVWPPLVTKLRRGKGRVLIFHFGDSDKLVKIGAHTPTDRIVQRIKRQCQRIKRQCQRL